MGCSPDTCGRTPAISGRLVGEQSTGRVLIGLWTYGIGTLVRLVLITQRGNLLLVPIADLRQDKKGSFRLNSPNRLPFSPSSWRKLCQAFGVWLFGPLPFSLYL